MKNNSTSCSINKQKGIAKNFSFSYLFFVYAQGFAKIFIFCVQKFWKIGPIAFHMKILEVKSRDEILKILLKRKFDNHIFCFVYGTIRRQFVKLIGKFSLSEKKLRTFRLYSFFEEFVVV